MQNPNCVRCRDDGFYFVVPRGNPFNMKIEVLAQNSRRQICDCEAGHALRRSSGDTGCDDDKLPGTAEDWRRAIPPTSNG